MAVQVTDDPRILYWQEADANIRRANGMSIEDPEFWATLLVGLVNATMAAVPAELIADIQARKQNTQRRVQKAVRKGLSKK